MLCLQTYLGRRTWKQNLNIDEAGNLLVNNYSVQEKKMSWANGLIEDGMRGGKD